MYCLSLFYRPAHGFVGGVFYWSMEFFMETLSVAMVVKDEGTTLESAIQSVLPIADELVIGVDRTSSDNTAEIAKKYASKGKYFEFDFENNFSQARNQALKRCDSDLIYILDGHEFCPPDNHPTPLQMARMRHCDMEMEPPLTPISFLNHIKKAGLPDEFLVVCGTLAMNTDDSGIPQLFFLQPRLFKNHVGIEYASAVHNYLDNYNRERALGCPESILVHNMPPKREKQRKKQRKVMNFGGLYADVTEERRKPLAEQSGRPFFYMGNSHADMGHPKKAVYWYEQYIKRSKFGEEHYQALQQLGVLYFRHLKEYDKAREYATRAVLMNWRRREPHILLGEMAEETGDLEESVHHYDKCDVIPAPDTVMFCQGGVYSFLPDIKRMQLYKEMGRYNKAIEHAERALSWRPGDPDIIQFIGLCNNAMRKGTKQKDRNFLMVDRLGSFTTELSNYLTRDFNVTRRDSWDYRWKAWADVAWFEWCDENIIRATQEEWHIPVICRLHSYEAFSDMPAQVQWDGVDHLVFVADHIRDLFLEKWPEVAKKTDIRVIPNGVHVEQFTFKERGHGRRIGYLGYLNHKKGVDLLVQAMHTFKSHEFHIAGQFQDPHLAEYFRDQIQALHNVYWYGWIEPERKDDWLDGVDYLISPSIVESFGFSIAEAMCKGIKPLIHTRPGAIWNDTWTTMEDLALLLHPESIYTSIEYRNHIKNNFSLERFLTESQELVEEAIRIKDDIKSPPRKYTLFKI